MHRFFIFLVTLPPNSNEKPINMQNLKEATSYRAALKERILEASMKAFTERGIKAVKMDDIASMLGISKRTLYEIYEDKERLLCQGIEKFNMQKLQHLAAYAASDHHVIDIILEAYRMKVREMHSVNPQFYDDILKYPAVAENLNKLHGGLHEKFIQFMKLGVDEGFFRQDIDYNLISQMTDAIGRHIMTNKLHRQYTVEKIFANFIMVVLRGLCTDKGLKALDAAKI